MNKFKLLNVSSNDEMGGNFNGFHLHEPFKQRGIQTSNAAFWNQTSKKDWSFNFSPGNLRRFQAEVVREIEIFSGFQSHFQWWSKDLLEHPNFIESDVVHLQVIHDHVLRFETLKKIALAKPTVWTWHDLWPVTGHCIFPGKCANWDGGCGNCPDLNLPLPVFRDRTKQEYKRKQLILPQLDLDIHVTTQWMIEKTAPHVENLGLRIHRFPFGIDLNTYAPKSGLSLRKKLGISPNAIVIFARSTDDERKGYLNLLKALDEISYHLEIHLVSVQQQGLASIYTDNLSVTEFPWTNKPSDVSQLYSLADVFVMPSTDESFGMMALEAMSCGRPVITTSGSATAEIVKCPELEIDENVSVESLRTVLERSIRTKDLLPKLGIEARERAVTNFSLNSYLDNLVGLYSETIERRRNA